MSFIFGWHVKHMAIASFAVFMIPFQSSFKTSSRAKMIFNTLDNDLYWRKSICNLFNFLMVFTDINHSADIPEQWPLQFVFYHKKQPPQVWIDAHGLAFWNPPWFYFVSFIKSRWSLWNVAINLDYGISNLYPSFPLLRSFRRSNVQIKSLPGSSEVLEKRLQINWNV